MSLNVGACGAGSFGDIRLPKCLRHEVMKPIGARPHGVGMVLHSWWKLTGWPAKQSELTGGGHWGGGMFHQRLTTWRDFGYLFLRNGVDRIAENCFRMDSMARTLTREANYGFAQLGFLNTEAEANCPLLPRRLLFRGNEQYYLYQSENDVVAVIR